MSKFDPTKEFWGFDNLYDLKVFLSEAKENIDYRLFNYNYLKTFNDANLEYIALKYMNKKYDENEKKEIEENPFQDLMTEKKYEEIKHLIDGSPSLTDFDELKKEALKAVQQEDSILKIKEPLEEKLEFVELILLDDFSDNIYSPQDDESFGALKNSISNNGVREPILIRPKEERYEILAGHNRVRACRELGLKTIKAIVLENLSDEEAEGIYIESNLLRKDKAERKPSELAKVYAKYSELKKVLGKRYDEIKQLLESNENFYEEKIGSREVLAYEFGITSRTISYYVRLNHLIKELLDRIDDGEIAVRAGSYLSFLNNEQQYLINDFLVEHTDFKITIPVAKKIKEHQEFIKDGHQLENFLIEKEESCLQDEQETVEKSEKDESKPKKRSIKLKEEFLMSFFDENQSDEEIMGILVQALRKYLREN